MVSVEFSKNKKVETRDISTEEFGKICSHIKSCVDIDYSGDKINGIDLLLDYGMFLSIYVGWDMAWGECEHYMSFSISDEDPREWKKEMAAHYAKLQEECRSE